MLLSIAQAPEEREPPGAPAMVNNHFFIMNWSGEQLRKVSLLIEEGMRPALDSLFAFDQYDRAFDRLASGETKGKIVLDLRSH